MKFEDQDPNFFESDAQAFPRPHHAVSRAATSDQSGLRRSAPGHTHSSNQWSTSSSEPSCHSRRAASSRTSGALAARSCTTFRARKTSRRPGRRTWPVARSQSASTVVVPLAEASAEGATEMSRS